MNDLSVIDGVPTRAVPEVNALVIPSCTDLFAKEYKNEGEIRLAIAALEAEMMKYEQVEVDLKHTLTTGVYAREVFIAKGTVIVGKIHRHDHLNFISYGDVTVLTKAGRQRFVGPCTMISTAGTKRALYAHEDTVWTTIHANPTNETDFEKLEDFIICKNYDEFPLLIEDKS